MALFREKSELIFVCLPNQHSKYLKGMLPPLLSFRHYERTVEGKCHFFCHLLPMHSIFDIPDKYNILYNGYKKEKAVYNQKYRMDCADHFGTCRIDHRLADILSWSFQAGLINKHK